MIDNLKADLLTKHAISTEIDGGAQNEKWISVECILGGNGKGYIGKVQSVGCINNGSLEIDRTKIMCDLKIMWNK